MADILIVEDDISLSNGIALALKQENRNFWQCFSIEEARNFLFNHFRTSKEIHLIILDIGLPDGSGIDFCKEIKQKKEIPIIFLTANDTELDEVVGLEAGADDYITKPFSLAVLRARVDAILRRNSKSKIKLKEIDEYIIIDDMVLDFASLSFKKGEKILSFSKTEQKLLYYLIQNKGKVVTREQLLNKIWDSHGEYVDTNALSVTMKRLRDKIEEDPKNPVYLKTVYGIGYTWNCFL